ncbi:condensin complex protein MksE [Flavitalea sp.]|nr:hypothetical protein [Flavitalea sp.]
MKSTRYTKDIFEKLSKGEFICSNSKPENVNLYNVADAHFEELESYFSAIGFILERGDEYFYFSRPEQKADLERKIEQTYRWIDILDFFKTFDTGFSAGHRFTVSDIIGQMKVDASLNEKLLGMRKLAGEGTIRQKIEKLIGELEKYDVVEIENSVTEQYKVLSSFKYLEQLVANIHISEEVNYEIS